MLLAVFRGGRTKMASALEKCSELILKQVFEESPGELSSKNPMVLSCGGIYIPHPESRAICIEHILVTPNHKEPVKVLKSNARRNALIEVMSKCSMN
jgi:hypothetical protein